MDLRLGVANFINGLHLTGHLRPYTAKLAAHTGKPFVRGVLTRTDGLQKYFQGRQIACIGNIQMAVILRMGVNNRVKLALFFRLILPVRIHGQAERIFPLVPVMDLQPFIGNVGKDFFLGAIRRFPCQVTRQQAVLFFRIHFFIICFHVHAK